MKKKRIINDELRKTFANKLCLVCNKKPSDPCHVKTKGAGGDDLIDNFFPACRLHHQEQHKIGIVTFALKYFNVELYLNKIGWEIKDIFGQKKLVRTIEIF